jgi:hypothetical protein
VRPDCWVGAFVTVVVGAALCLAHYHLHLQLWPMQASVMLLVRLCILEHCLQQAGLEPGGRKGGGSGGRVWPTINCHGNLNRTASATAVDTLTEPLCDCIVLPTGADGDG